MTTYILFRDIAVFSNNFTTIRLGNKINLCISFLKYIQASSFAQCMPAVYYGNIGGGIRSNSKNG